MEKTATLNLRINPVNKNNAENVLKQLGIPMATAIDMFLRQISMTGNIPFAVKLPAPQSINADMMSDAELEKALLEGFEQAEAGKFPDYEEIAQKFRNKR